MPADQYREADGLSFSMLKILSQKSPAHLRAYIHGEKKPATDAMRMGSLTHSFILEPETAKGFVVRPEGMKFTTKEGQAWKQAHEAMTIISQDDLKALKGMAEAVHSHPIAKRMLCGGEAEQSLFSRDSSGLMRKGRLDYLQTKGNVVVDLKTCSDASPLEFGKNVANYFYLGQAYYYLKLCQLCGLEKDTFAFIAVEKEAPYAVAVYQPPDDWLEAAGKIVEADVQRYRNCLESGEWPAYGNEILPLELPSYHEKLLTNINQN